MRRTTLRRAAGLALACQLIGATAVYADTIPADGDQVTAGNQPFVNLGEHAPGSLVSTTVSFALTCAGINHADEGQTVRVELSGVTVPLDGAATASSTTIGPVPAEWTDDGEGCPSPAPTLASNGLSTVTLRMPTTPAEGYLFSLMYARIGANGLTGLTAISFEVDVVANTPPSLVLPASISAEATGPAGAAVTFAVGATDLEDEPDPNPVCSPASGAVFPLGTTSVECSVTDVGGLSASGSFTVTVSDTSSPVLALPGGLTAEATAPSGATVAFSASASDAVDGPIAVACDHDSGDTFVIGSTTVGCSAVDAAGNPVSGSFVVTVADTTAPTFGALADVTVTTNNEAGATVSYPLPTATDAVDAAPTVLCSPVSGSAFAVGSTAVTCTATDATGNRTTAGFTVTVQFVPDEPGVVWSVSWGEPIGGSPAVLVTNTSRNVPVKVRIIADGVEQTSGSARLRVVGCDGTLALVIPLSWGSGRWDAHLDTSPLVPGCYLVTVTLNGDAAGSFALDVRGGESTKSPAKDGATSADTTSGGHPGHGKDKVKPPKK